jgi:hypothetical protein
LLNRPQNQPAFSVCVPHIETVSGEICKPNEPEAVSQPGEDGTTIIVENGFVVWQRDANLVAAVLPQRRNQHL